MVLKFKQRGNDIKKVLVYGADGSGKSTFAENYCNENNLSPVVIDVDDTNYTNLPIIEIDLSSDMVAYRNIIRTIKEVKVSNFDTIILDGVTSLLEVLTSKAKGIKKYSDRAERFSAIINELLQSGKNIIFIGQIDMKVIHNEEFQSPKPIIKINSIVNEKYLCIKKENKYTFETEKYRVCENTVPAHQEQKTSPKSDDVFVTADVVGEPNPDDDPLKSQCFMIKDMVEAEGKEATKQNMKKKVVQVAKEQGLPTENKKALLEYISKHCPEELQ